MEKSCAESVVSNSVTGSTFLVPALCDECFDYALEDLKNRMSNAITSFIMGGAE